MTQDRTDSGTGLMSEIVIREEAGDRNCSDPLRGVECQDCSTHQEGAGYLVTVQRPDVPAPGGTDINS